jgi:hypothetical protein
MFIGHYGVAFAAKDRAPELRLAQLFVAVQALDILFGILLLSGVEHMRINATPSLLMSGASRNIYDVFELYDMHLSHSLLGALGWSVAGVLAARLRLPWKASLWLGAAVLSHFLLDIPMHPDDARHLPDLRIGGMGTPGIGFGLWNHPIAAVALELGTFAAGVAIFARSHWPLRPRLWSMIAVLAIFALLPLFIPASGTRVTFAVQILVMTGALALWAGWAERVER